MLCFRFKDDSALFVSEWAYLVGDEKWGDEK